MFGRAVFEAIEVKGCLRLNFEAAVSESLAANLKNVAGLFVTNGS
jgi:hypothetical protein